MKNNICYFCNVKDRSHPPQYVKYKGRFRRICSNCFNGDNEETKNIIGEFE